MRLILFLMALAGCAKKPVVRDAADKCSAARAAFRQVEGQTDERAAELARRVIIDCTDETGVMR